LLSQLDGINVQYEDDKKNFMKLTKAPIKIMGNLKLDVTPPRNIANRIRVLKSQLKIKDQFVILASSTRKGEEEEIINLISNLKLTNFILIVVPRHPERFNNVAKIFEKRKLPYSRRSKYKSFTKTPIYILGDSMGELYDYYGLANLAIIGGSILDYGCQNPIESLSMQVPTAVGPSIYNFKDIVEAAEADGSVIRFSKTKDLEKIIAKLLKDKIEKNSVSQKNLKKLLKETNNSSKIVENLISQYF
jgi:3-deoxy-D-manno-octulosonic-acid transferase